jgi:hypothetical protein
MLKRLLFGAVAVAALLPVHASAQRTDADTITLYDRGNFKGRSLTFEGPTRLSSPFNAKSIKFPEGKAWELCSGNTFTGCKEFNRSDSAMVFNVRSARPVAPVITSAPGGAPIASVGTVGGGPWPSLRGLASEYFIAPDVGGNRILVASGKSEEASRLAEDFCRTRGWRTSAHERLQSIGGRTYLADVLCAEGKR